MKVLSVLLALGIVFLSPVSYSQTLSNVLEGFTSLQIHVGDTDQDAADCGVTKASLRSAASFPIATSRLRIREKASLIFSVNVIVVPTTKGSKPGCASAYDVVAYMYGFFELPPTQTKKAQKIQLWEDGGLIVGPMGDFGRRMSAKIDALAKEFVVDWTLDQQ